ncbi:MAG: hypothetical protein ABI950_07365 [Solirubrobacteraceae bacterium]
MTSDGPGVDRIREQLARRDAAAEDAPDPPAEPPREELDERERAVRDERRRSSDG